MVQASLTDDRDVHLLVIVRLNGSISIHFTADACSNARSTAFGAHRSMFRRLKKPYRTTLTRIKTRMTTSSGYACMLLASTDPIPIPNLETIAELLIDPANIH